MVETWVALAGLAVCGFLLGRWLWQHPSPPAMLAPLNLPAAAWLVETTADTLVLPRGVEIQHHELVDGGWDIDAVLAYVLEVESL